MHIELFPDHHSPQHSDDSLNTLICVLSGIVLTAYGFSTNAISVSHSFSFTAFVLAILYASSGAAASYFVKLGLDAAKAALVQWYKNRKDGNNPPSAPATS